MDKITVKVVAGGLIALAPILNQEGQIGEFAALVLNTSDRQSFSGFQTESHDSCLGKHEPTIRFPVPDGVQCGKTLQRKTGGEYKCSYSAGFCTCPLEGDEISLSPTNPSTLRYDSPLAASKPPSLPLPFSSSHRSAGSLDYVVNLNHLGRSLDPVLLSPDPGEVLAARFRMPVESAVACRLATRRVGRADHVHSFGLRPVGLGPDADDLVQAVAQEVVLQFSIPCPEEISENPAQLVLKSMNGDLKERIFKLHGEEVVIELMNHRSPEAQVYRGQPCDDGIGRDFALFYDLTQEVDPETNEKKPTGKSWRARRVPHVELTEWRSIKDLNPSECRVSTRGPASRPICAMARFDPVSMPEEGTQP